MKKIVVITSVVLVSLITAFSILSSKHQNSTPLTQAEAKVDIKKLKANFGNNTNGKNIYFKQPFPTDIPTDAQCEELNYTQYQLRDNNKRDIEFKALQAFKNGYTAKQVAEAIWFSSHWSVAKDWYDKAALAESVEKLLPILQSIPNSERLISQYSYVNAPDTNITTVVDYTGSLDILWKNLPTDTIYKKVNSTNTPAVEIFNEIERTFSEIPYEVLNNNQLSPLNSILNLLLTKQQLQSAILLLQRYPDLMLSDVNFDNKLALTFLTIIGSEDYEITDLTEHQLFFTLLGLLKKQVFYQKVTHPWFSNEEVNKGVEKLNDEGIVIKIVLVDDIEKPNPILQLNIKESELTAEQQLSLKKCQSTKDWFTSRELTLNEIETFIDQPFIAKIKSSPEFEHCKNKKVLQNLPLIKSQFAAVSKVINQAIGNQNSSLEELDLESLDLPVLLPETKSILAVFIARDYLQATSLNEQEIIARLSNVGLKPVSSHSELLGEFAGLKGVTLWLNSLNFEQLKDAQVLLNRFAAEGVFEPFAILNTRLGGVVFNDNELDPLYFFIQNYSALSIHSGDPITYENKKNKAFIDFFNRNGVHIEPQHLRAAFALKIRYRESYNRLINYFPELEVKSGEDYFSVNCR
ncbi:hypothetical protein H5119_02510 [Pseudoalteromonas sp. SG45-5]|uniref:hypothetical protein n=1 Tax=unclassified Pseudoalteromonas TaxID=194690 RepID=UPI0015F9123D|nr:MULTISPECIES: hypothetical protein [unclassified Pseudoalteromonas]MBB1384433.1 hypothetical protein [Pseudoalteromonas sp. SG45-5]MBB1392279.1 hypothetical protein [Pseudoalteromonas sp. SG44-4]MBB1445844.1 hypothetical protein [Pseudoalteromonas sp. SG41-6]